MTKWHKVGLFNNEDQARKSCPAFFANAKYEPHFKLEGNMDALYINKDYWIENCVMTPNVCAECKEKYPNKNWYEPCGCMQADK